MRIGRAILLLSLPVYVLNNDKVGGCVNNLVIKKFLSCCIAFGSQQTKIILNEEIHDTVLEMLSILSGRTKRVELFIIMNL